MTNEKSSRERERISGGHSGFLSSLRARAREEEDSHSEQATDATHGRNGWLPLTAIEEAGGRLAGGRAHKLDLVRGFLGQRRRGAAISILNPRHYRGSLVRPVGPAALVCEMVQLVQRGK